MPSESAPEAVSPSEPDPYSSLYAEFVRPWLGELLQALRLDLSYLRGDGNRLYTDQGREVLDFLGGYGANFFGHWHPRLKAALIGLAEAQVPIQAQGSVRRRAASLAEALSRRVKAETGQDYVVTFTNSGAEAVEAALKHAKLAYAQRRQRFLAGFRQQAAVLQQRQTDLPESWLPVLAQIGYEGPPHLREALAFIDAHNRTQLGRSPWLLAMQRGFHGKTTAAVQLTANLDYREPFTPLGFKTRFLAPDAAALAEVAEDARGELVTLGGKGTLGLKPWTCIVACFAEPLQGEGGIHPLPADFLQACRALADREGFALILDEIQCGLGRTGSFLYSSQLGVIGDYYLLAKSLGGGLTKLGALLVRKDQYCYRFGKLHSSTFAEDELSAGVALEALALLDEADLMARAAASGESLLAGFRQLQREYPDVIADVRGAGLMLGIEFAHQEASPSPALRMLSRQELLGYAITGFLLYEHGLRVAPTLSSPLTLRIEPAATITAADCGQLLAGLSRVCEVLHKANVYHLTRFLVGLEGGEDEIKDLREPGIDWDPIDPSLPQVAFAGHFIEARHMPLWDPGYGLFPTESLEPYLDRVYRHLGPDIYDRRTVVSATGAKVQLSFIGLCVGSRQMNEALRSDPAPMAALLSEALELAARAGCTVLGLGGYCSIVTANGTALPPDRLAITTGNALTVGMGLRAIHQAAESAGIRLESSCFAALGANGNIASVYTELMADEVPRILLIGRAGREGELMKVASRLYAQALERIARAKSENRTSDLQGIAASIFHSPAFHRLARTRDLGDPAAIEALHAGLGELGEQAPIRIATEIEALRSADLILGASNAPGALIYPALLSSGPRVICDVSVPADTHHSVFKERPDVLVIQGGIVRLPHNPAFIIGGIPLERSLSFACMGETLLMGLTGMGSHFSYGRITREQVQTILSLADLHGFSLGRARLENSY